MTAKPTISIRDVFDMFPDETSARQHLEKIRWANNVSCPHCESKNIYIRKARAGRYDCRACRAYFSVKTGTIFDKSHIQLHKWIYAIYLLMASHSDTSPLQLSKEIGITQKAAWLMWHRLHLACGGNMEQLRGIVEINKARIGKQKSAKRERKTLRTGRGKIGKQAIVEVD